MSVKINDGIIKASDSASTFATGQIYLTADKIVNLVKGLPIGVMVTGNGGIGSESIATLFKDLCKRLDGLDAPPHPWALDRTSYTMKEVAERVREFLFVEKVAPTGQDAFVKLRICGYSAGRPLPEIWEVVLQGKQCDPPSLAMPEDRFGVNWDGEYEPLNRMILGLGTDFRDAAVAVSGLQPAQIDPLIGPLMPGFAVTRHTRWICGLIQWFTEDGFRECVYDVVGAAAGSITAMTCLALPGQTRRIALENQSLA